MFPPGQQDFALLLWWYFRFPSESKDMHGVKLMDDFKPPVGVNLSVNGCFFPVC